MHRHASTYSCWCEQHKGEHGTNRNWVHQIAQAMAEQLRGQAGVEDAGTEEEIDGYKEDARNCP